MAQESIESLGILLTRGPGSPEAGWATALVRAAVRRGIEVRVFLMAEGVDLLREPARAILDLPRVRVAACTLSVTERAAPMDRAGVDYASQFQLGRLLEATDRFVSFS